MAKSTYVLADAIQKRRRENRKVRCAICNTPDLGKLVHDGLVWLSTEDGQGCSSMDLYHVLHQRGQYTLSRAAFLNHCREHEDRALWDGAKSR